MDPVKIVQFDIHGKEPLNKIVGEEMPIKDKTCPWLIPNGSPYFAEGNIFKLYDQRGGLLTLGRDFFFEEEFIPFCDLSGRSICTFIRLSERVLAENDFVKANYQSIGAWFVPRNDLDKWLEEITNGKIPIPWSKVFGVPPTLPPEFHSHHTATEITDWYELSFFFNYMAGIYRTRDSSLFDKADQIIEASFAQLTAVKNAQLAKLVTHDSNYSAPHQPTKADLLLGNLDNFPTATLAEELAGTPNRFSTPQGVQEKAKTYIPNTDAAMKNGILPIGQFGNNSFIPPNITGSFEGIGQATECSGICLERSGIVMLLSNHNDGRTKGLYFSTVENYLSQDAVVTYTNYRYDPPVLSAIGINVDRIIAGSGNKVIMVGASGTNDWFIALTNSTFDPASHSYVRCDMSEITAVYGNPYGNPVISGLNDRATIHHMGKYLVLVQSNTGTDGLKQRFFRVLTEDVLLNKPVKWTPLRISYANYDGVQSNNVLEFIIYPYVKDSAGLTTKVGNCTLLRPVNVVGQERRALSFSAPIKNGGGAYYYHSLQSYVFFDLFSDAQAYSIIASGISYSFNPETGVFNLRTRPTEKILKVDGSEANRSTPGWDRYRMALTGVYQPSSVMLDNGDILTAYIEEGETLFPVRFSAIKFENFTSAETLLSGTLEHTRAKVKTITHIKPVIKTATRNGSYPSAVNYETNGEVFVATDQLDYTRKMYYRVVEGNYEIRPAVNNLTLGSLYSRPLSSDIYLTNLSPLDGVMSVTGGATELAAAGLTGGTSSLAYFGYSKRLGAGGSSPINSALKAADPSMFLTFPRTYSKVLNKGEKTAQYKGDTFYGIRQNIIDRLEGMALVPGDNRWCFNWAHFGAESGGMFAGLNISLVSVYSYNPVDSKIYCRPLLVRPVVETPNTNHPGTYWIKDFQILHDLGQFLAGPALSTEGPFGNYGRWVGKPHLVAYKEGVNLKVLANGIFSIPVKFSTDYLPVLLCDINLTTEKFVNFSADSTPGGYGEYGVIIPKVGVTDLNVVSNSPTNNRITRVNPLPYDYTGGAGTVFKKNGVGNFLIASVYPETGWVLFIQENIKMMVNGTAYVIGGGTIDLRDIEEDPRNKTFYVYATIDDSTPKYVVSVKKLHKRSNLLPAATLTTNDKQILTIVRHQSFMIGDYLLSDVREGGIIPVSSGFPQDPGNFPFLRASELLP